MPAENLCPHREEASVFPLDNIFLIDRFGKARPSGAGIELVSRAEKLLSCDDIHIQSRFLIVPVGIVKCRFSCSFLGHPVLEVRQTLF